MRPLSLYGILVFALPLFTARVQVSQKKDNFYSCMLPLALNANKMVMELREEIEDMRKSGELEKVIKRMQLD